MKLLSKSMMAGIMITIAGYVCLKCGGIAGAAIFSVGLTMILVLNFSLYTGMVCYIDRPKALLKSACVLCGNAIGCFVAGFFLPTEAAAARIATMLAKAPLKLAADAFFCGLLIYCAVESYRQMRSLAPVMLGVITFVLSGFEHSIADIGYLIMGRVWSVEACFAIIVVIAGNAAGGILVPALKHYFWREDGEQ